MKMSFVKVYYADVSPFFDNGKLESMLYKVSPERRERINTAKRSETKAQLLGAELIRNAALLKATGRCDYAFSKGEFGKPYITDAENVFFNVSHSGKFVVCAVSDAEVGCDIEEINAQGGFMEGVADRFFSLFEKNAIALSPNKPEAFCRLWTLRESYVKMRGVGFTGGLAYLTCVFPDGVPRMMEKGKTVGDAFFTEIRDIYLCRGAVCTQSPAEYSIEKLTLLTEDN